MEKSTACSIFTNNLEFGWTKIRVAKNCFPPCLAISQKKVRSPQSLAAKDLFQNLLGNQWLYGICNFLVLRDAAWRPKEDNKDWSSKRKSWAPQCSVDRPCLPVEKPWSCQVCHWFGSWSILPRQSIEYIHVFIYIYKAFDLQTKDLIEACLLKDKSSPTKCPNTQQHGEFCSVLSFK